MPLPPKKKICWAVGALMAATLAGAAVFVFLLTREVPVELTQDPNAVEAHEANRKLNLLTEAEASRRKGFVRLSEVEINSFLDARFNTNTIFRTNSGVRLVKCCVQLQPPNLTFVTWHKTPVLGMELPLLWQRTVVPMKETNGWTFELRQMRLGKLEIPEQLWGTVERWLGTDDQPLHGREQWLSKIPSIALTRNELSQLPELRLYTYVPDHLRP